MGLGYCNGLAFLYLLYAAQNRTDYFFDTMRLMINWDNSLETLNKPFPTNLPQAKYYKNLKELFEQWINDITLFQYPYSIGLIAEQKDRSTQHAIIGRTDELSPIMLFSEDEKKQPPIRSKEQLSEVLYYLMRMPSGSRIEIGAAEHAISLYKDDEDKIHLYDSNFRYEVSATDKIEEIVQRIINFKYILLRKYNDKVPCSVHVFYFKKDESQLDLENFRVFKEEELPKSKEEADSFQAKSPTLFTHLHVAVMTHSIPVIKKLLEDDNCNLMAVDSFGRTVFDLIIDVDNVQHDLLKLFLAEPKTKNLEALLLNAIKKGDLPLIKMLLDSGRIDINKPHGVYGVLPLHLALRCNRMPIIEVLLERGANILLLGRSAYTDSGAKKSALKFVLANHEELYPLFIAHQKDANQMDEDGNAPIHYALKYGRPGILEDLLDRGANPNLLDREGRHSVDITIHGRISRISKEEILQLLIPLLDKEKFLEYFSAYTSERQVLSDIMYPLLLETCQNNKMILNARNAQGFAPLHVAVMGKQFSQVKQLVKAGCDVDAVLMPSKNTLLISLIKFKSEEYPAEKRYKLIKLFLDHKADVTLSNANGETALDLARNSSDEKLKAIFVERNLLQEMSHKK